MPQKVKNVALIPARAGSKRIVGKNIRYLSGKPLIAFSIQAAIKSNVFQEVIVSTDCPEIAKIAMEFGAKVPKLRPRFIARDLSPDIEWVKHAIEQLVSTPIDSIEFIAILRPTNPLRSSETIRNAIEFLRGNPWADSLRAMEITTKHPGKMWKVAEGGEATPYLNQSIEPTPTHSRPTQSLEKLWVQNASLEVVKLEALLATQSISGRRILSFEMPGYEGFDLNTEEDWNYLEFLLDADPSLIELR